MAENVAMKLIGLITTIVILGAVYLFFVKPVLDTTNNAFDSVNETFQESGLGDIDSIIEDNAEQIRQQLVDSGVNPKKAKRYANCLNAAGTDQGELQACAEKFG